MILEAAANALESQEITLLPLVRVVYIVQQVNIQNELAVARAAKFEAQHARAQYQEIGLDQWCTAPRDRIRILDRKMWITSAVKGAHWF